VVFSGLESLHDLIMVWLVAILAVVILVSSIVLSGPITTSLIPDSEILEKTWTLIPILILISIAFPSIHLLCLQDSFIHIPSTRIKIIRNQWNWQRESNTFSYDHLLDSYSLDLIRTYEVPILLKNSRIRILLTRTDVLHSLGFPSIGVKLDSAPGRLNSTVMEVLRPGLFVGSCYELCGSGHRVMPINVIVL